MCVCVFVSKERKEELTQAKNTIMISGFADTGTAMGSGGQPFKFRDQGAFNLLTVFFGRYLISFAAVRCRMSKLRD